MAELADAADLNSAAREGVRVRTPAPAPDSGLDVVTGRNRPRALRSPGRRRWPRGRRRRPGGDRGDGRHGAPRRVSTLPEPESPSSKTMLIGRLARGRRPIGSRKPSHTERRKFFDHPVDRHPVVRRVGLHREVSAGEDDITGRSLTPVPLRMVDSRPPSVKSVSGIPTPGWRGRPTRAPRRSPGRPREKRGRVVRTPADKQKGGPLVQPASSSQSS